MPGNRVEGRSTLAYALPVARHPEAPCEANLSSLKEIEKPAGIKELLAVGGLSFTSLRRVRRDVNRGDDMGVGASLCDHGPAVAVANQDARARLAIKGYAW